MPDVAIFHKAAIQKAAANIGLEPEEVAIITGIGCCRRISGYIKPYGILELSFTDMHYLSSRCKNEEVKSDYLCIEGGDGDGML